MEPSTQPTQFPSPTPPSAPKRSHKKLIIIIASIAALLLIGGGTVGVLLLFKGSNSPAKEETAFDGSGPADPDYVFTPDLSKDYGACTILQKNTIKLALGTVADNLDGPNNVGRVQVAKGDDSQVCSYGFTKSTAENTLNIDNGLTVEVYKYKDQEAINAAKANPYAGSEKIDGSSEGAVFLALPGDARGLTSYSLIVYSGLTHYKYMVTQPTAESTMSAAYAKNALITLAKSATY